MALAPRLSHGTLRQLLRCLGAPDFRKWTRKSDPHLLRHLPASGPPGLAQQVRRLSSSTANVGPLNPPPELGAGGQGHGPTLCIGRTSLPSCRRRQHPSLPSHPEIVNLRESIPGAIGGGNHPPEAVRGELPSQARRSSAVKSTSILHRLVPFLSRPDFAKSVTLFDHETIFESGAMFFFEK